MNVNRPTLLNVVVALLALLTLCSEARSQEAPIPANYTHYRMVFPPGQNIPSSKREPAAVLDL